MAAFTATCLTGFPLLRMVSTFVGELACNSHLILELVNAGEKVVYSSLVEPLHFFNLHHATHCKTIKTKRDRPGEVKLWVLPGDAQQSRAAGGLLSLACANITLRPRLTMTRFCESHLLVVRLSMLSPAVLYVQLLPFQLLKGEYGSDGSPVEGIVVRAVALKQAGAVSHLRNMKNRVKKIPAVFPADVPSRFAAEVRRRAILPQPFQHRACV